MHDYARMNKLFFENSRYSYCYHNNNYDNWLCVANVGLLCLKAKVINYIHICVHARVCVSAPEAMNN